MCQDRPTLDTAAWRAVRQRIGWFILVYRLAMDERPCGVMVSLAENIQACLRDFQTGTASMARKRHLASSTRGLFGICLMAQIGVQEVQGVQ